MSIGIDLDPLLYNEQVHKLHLEDVFNKPVHISPRDFLAVWMARSPTINSKQDCVETIRGEMSDELMHEISFGAKLSLIAYAMPFYMSVISTHFHESNLHFMKGFSGLNNDPEFQRLIFQHMDNILDGETRHIVLPDDNQIAGFYIRTPIRIWNSKLKRIYKIPKWPKREDLVKFFVIGNTNVYVIRQNLVDGYELHVLFRGTSNEFNGIPQYGHNWSNTQVFHLPDFNIETQTFHKEGSDSIPLFYFYYSSMISDIKNYIYDALESLGVEKCQKILVVGHSMGAGLGITFAYTSKFDKPEWWEKMQFRQYAGPLACNDAAAHILEQWVGGSKFKMIEVVNHDDFVNCQHMFGGKEGFQQSLEAGTSSVMAWLVKNGVTKSDHPDWLKSALRSIQLHPDIVMGLFLNSASAKQPRFASAKSHPVRPGQRKKETGVNVVYCSRRIIPSQEYLGKSHEEYVNITMSLFWTILRLYEDSLYKYYSEHGLHSRNKLFVIPLFAERDIEQARKLVFKITSSINKWQPSKNLMKNYFQ